MKKGRYRGYKGIALFLALIMTLSVLLNGTIVFGQEAGTTQNSDKKSTAEILKMAEKSQLTQKALRSLGAEMDQDKISLDHFDFECHDQKHDGQPVDLKPAIKEQGYQKGISSGALEQNVPRTFSYNGNDHMYKNAYVGATQVYYAGVLEIDGNSYIYYITDKEKTDTTVYSILKEGQKIKVRYDHSVAHTIDYEFYNEDEGVTSTTNGPENWSLDKIFGENRPELVAHRGYYADKVTIPRGYEATVSIYNVASDGTRTLASDKAIKLGGMQEYEKKANEQIVLKPGSVQTLQYEGTLSGSSVEANQVVVFSYKKNSNPVFNASLWASSNNVKSRIKVEDSSTLTSSIPTENGTYTWKFTGISSRGATWELDQLEINGESINVPMTKLDNTSEEEETTTLSSGTVVTLTVKSKGGQNGNNGARDYTLKVDNCRENITITGGNLVGHAHKEIVVNKMHGVSDGKYFNTLNNKTEDLYQKKLIGRKGAGNNVATGYFWLKRGTGYRYPNISVTTKEGVLLQENGSINRELVSSDCIEYFVKDKDGTYRQVTYENWTESSDGYLYFRGSKALTNFMWSSDKNGVALLNIDAEPIKTAVDYETGGNRDYAPAEENIENMPSFDTGGSTGYTCEKNSHVIISTKVPRDKTGEYLFDHWEVLTVDTSENPMGTVTDQVKQLDGEPVTFQSGQAVDVTTTVYQKLKDCYYYKNIDQEESRAVITLRPVWVKANTSEVIHYNVHFFVNDAEILVRSHTVDKGGRLISDLYERDNKTLSKNLQNILAGNNTSGTKFTGRYIVDKNRTTLKIDNVTENDNRANIYLVSGDTQISVTLNWSENAPEEQEARVQLQRRVKGSQSWENTGDEVSLTKANHWTHDFTELQKYKNDDVNDEYEYRIVEVKDQNVIEQGGAISFGEHWYGVGYEEKDNGSWVITNTYKEKEEPTTPTEPTQPTQPTQPGTSESGESQPTSSAASASSAQTGSSQQTADSAATTGDDFAPILWIAIAAAALAGIVVMLVSTRRRKTGKK